MPHESDIRQVLWQLAFQFKVSAKRAVRQHDLKLNGMHVRLLQMIHAHPGCTANRLVTITGRDKAQITRVIQELESMGLIARTPHPDDRRSHLLALSNDGESLMTRIGKAEDEVERALLKGISRQDQATFIEIGNRMLTNLQDSDPE
ncbi:MarR family winged helix-turn-helix transcriptional regulator [Halomonas sp. WWR20]